MKVSAALIVIAIAARSVGAPAHSLRGAAVDVILAITLAAIVIRGPHAPALRPAPHQYRKLAYLAPPAILLQVILGTLYRHEIWGILPHMAGAALAGSLTLILCVLLIQHQPEFQKPAVIVMAILLAQIALGITTFVLRLLDMETTIWFTIASTAHVTVGAITLAATASLGRLVVGNPAAHRHDPRPQNE